jgi:RNA polymerase sigma factor (TIGR02999 family)
MKAKIPGEITQLLESWQEGNQGAFEDLLPLVYDELRSLARVYLRKERQGHTLQPTALVHEAYVRLTGASGAADFKNRGHFFAVAAQAMRWILVDHTRKQRAGKRISPEDRIPLENAPILAQSPDLDILDLHEALERLAEVNQRQAKLVELRYFGGLTQDEAAEVLEISRATAERDWRVARLWLHRQLS